MCATFTDDDVGKTVLNANGDEVGIISAVQHGTAHVEPDPGITDTIKVTLGWEGADEDTYPLQEHAVDHVTDDHVHLKSDLSGLSDSSRTTDAGTDVGSEGDVGTGRDRTDEGGITDDSGITDDGGITDDSGITDDRDDTDRRR